MAERYMRFLRCDTCHRLAGQWSCTYCKGMCARVELKEHSKNTVTDIACTCPHIANNQYTSTCIPTNTNTQAESCRYRRARKHASYIRDTYVHSYTHVQTQMHIGAPAFMHTANQTNSPTDVHTCSTDIHSSGFGFTAPSIDT